MTSRGKQYMLGLALFQRLSWLLVKETASFQEYKTF